MFYDLCCGAARLLPKIAFHERSDGRHGMDGFYLASEGTQLFVLCYEYTPDPNGAHDDRETYNTVHIFQLSETTGEWSTLAMLNRPHNGFLGMINQCFHIVSCKLRPSCFLIEQEFVVANNILYFITRRLDTVVLESFDVSDRTSNVMCNFPPKFMPKTLFCLGRSVYAISYEYKLMRVTDGVLEEISMTTGNPSES